MHVLMTNFRAAASIPVKPSMRLPARALRRALPALPPSRPPNPPDTTVRTPTPPSVHANSRPGLMRKCGGCSRPGFITTMDSRVRRQATGLRLRSRRHGNLRTRRNRRDWPAVSFRAAREPAHSPEPTRLACGFVPGGTGTCALAGTDATGLRFRSGRRGNLRTRRNRRSRRHPGRTGRPVTALARRASRCLTPNRCCSQPGDAGRPVRAAEPGPRGGARPTAPTARHLSRPTTTYHGFPRLITDSGHAKRIKLVHKSSRIRDKTS
jgi:hypothetical protein